MATNKKSVTQINEEIMKAKERIKKLEDLKKAEQTKNDTLMGTYIRNQWGCECRQDVKAEIEKIAKEKKKLVEMNPLRELNPQEINVAIQLINMFMPLVRNPSFTKKSGHMQSIKLYAEKLCTDYQIELEKEKATDQNVSDTSETSAQ